MPDLAGSGSFTPGPWRESDAEDGTLFIYGSKDDGNRAGPFVCEINGTHPQGRADARLIAAAPDLFLALQHATAFATRLPKWVVEEAANALAKAEVSDG